MKAAYTICSLLFAITALAQGEKGFIVKGNKLYKQKAYEEAAAEYKKATVKNAKSAEAIFNLGNAHYKSKKPFDAMQAYKGAFETSSDKNLRSQAAYNQGVLLTRQQKLPECIEEYKTALRLNPTDVQARENLQKALNELKKQQQQNQDQNQNKNQNKDNDDNQENENKSNLSKKRAEQMLNALRQEEKKIQQSMQDKNKGGRLQTKDW